MSPDDDTRLRHLSDRAEISDVQLAFATAVDFGDWELYRSCFTDDAEIDYSSGFGMDVVRLTVDDWDGWIEGVASSQGRMQAQHLITNLVITFDEDGDGVDDHATCVSYLLASAHGPNLTGSSGHSVYGVYTNRFERTSSGWRIAKLQLTVRWMTGNFALYSGDAG